MAGVMKLFPAEMKARRSRLIPLAVAAGVAAMFMQSLISPQAREIRKYQQNIAGISGGLNNEFMLLPLLGFREAAAGLLWVRCDEFFHSGDYDAILPLVRLITWLDPHADNVFITGAWHLAYNFTDSNERSDRRYIAPAQSLLDEGIRANMGTPDIKFEKGWQNYDKIKNYPMAEEAFRMAIATKPNRANEDSWPFGAPLKANHILAHALAKQGRIPAALVEWNESLNRSTQLLNEAEKVKDMGQKFKMFSMNQSEKRNIETYYGRYRDRYTSSGHTDVNKAKHPGVLGLNPKAAPKLWDVAFKPKVEIIRPKVMKVSGQAVTADGARIDIRLTDWDYVEKKVTPGSPRFDVDQSQTIMMEQASIRKAKFEREIDMSKDPKMYGFFTDTYKLTMSFNPRNTSPHVQDRVGYSGEGMTNSDKRFLFVDKRPELQGTRMIDLSAQGVPGEGQVWDGKDLKFDGRGQPPILIRVTYKLSKAQIMGQAPITEKDIVSNE